MYYVTVNLPPECHQMSLDELLFGGEAVMKRIQNSGKSNFTVTRTYELEYMSYRIMNRVNVPALVHKLEAFNDKYAELREKPRKSLYREFYIPKKSGGLRKIDAPCDELKEALYELKKVFEDDFGALYHTSAYAYIEHRCTVDAIRKHQRNESKWFGKYDLSNFFGSITPEYLMHIFKMVYPFSEVIRRAWDGEKILRTALDLCFLDGGLPQGTPISPMLTNLLMIPVDYKLTKAFREWDERCVYTRYADDFLVSSKYNFDYKKAEKLIVDTLAGFGAPFTINGSKTRYGSSSGRNWNLGVMLNKDNEITVGYKKKKLFQTMLYNFLTCERNGEPWDIGAVQQLLGNHSYYREVEKETIDKIVAHFNEKNGVDIIKMIKDRLK